MKTTIRQPHFTITAGLCCLALLLSLPARAANITKAGSGTDLTDGASWGGSVAPISSDVAVWGTGSLGTGLTLNSGTPSWLGITVNAAAADPINIASGGTLTLGTSGINMSASTINATLGCDLSLASGYQSWLVASGKTLAINGALTRAAGASMSFPATGVTSTTLANDSTGILGGWATVTGTSDWATNSSVTGVGTYTGYTSVTGNQTGAGASAQNWKNTAGTTLTASATINSLNQQFDFTVNSGVTLTLGSGGLILGSTERWLLGTSGTLKSGLATGELYIHANTATFANGFQIQPTIVDGLVATVVTKDGNGQCEMGNATNSFSGGFFLNAGAVYLGSSSTGSGGSVTRGPLGTGLVTLNGGSLFVYGKANGSSGTASGFTLANNINIPTGASATINNGGGNGVLSGNISGVVPTFLGAGLTALQGANTYSGNTTITVGTLGIGNTAGVNNNLSTGTIIVTNGGTLRAGYAVTSNANKTYIPNDIVLGGGTLYEDDAFQHLTGNINVTAASILGSTYNGGGGDVDKGLYVDGLVNGSSNLTIQISHYDSAHTYDTAYVVFTNNANTYSGTITINENSATTEGGVYLGVNGSTTLANATINVPATIPGANLRFGTSPIVFKNGLGSVTLGALAGFAPVVLAGYDPSAHTYAGGGNIALTVGANNSSTSYSNVLSGAGSLIKSGSGTFTLAGTNTYTGSTTISAGTLTIGGAGLLGGGNYFGAIINNSSLNYASSAAQTLSGPLSGSGTLSIAGGSKLIVSGLQSSSQNVAVNDGATLIDALSSPFQLTATSLTVGTSSGAALGFVINRTSPAPLVAGTLTFNGVNNINILGGNLVAGASYPLIAFTTQAGSGSYVLGTVPNGVGGNLSTSGNTIYFNVTGVTNTVWTGLVNGTWDINTTANWTNAGTLGTKYIDGSVVQFDDTGINTTTISNSVATTLTPAGILVTNNSLNYCLKTNTIIAGLGTLTKTGTAALTNATPNTYTGPTIINQGSLVAGVASVANVSGAVGNNSPVTLGTDATATLNLNGFATQIGSLTGGGTTGGNVVLGSGTLTVGGDNSSPATYAGVISGTGGLTKIGSGTLALNNTNSYTGATTVSSGKLSLTGSATIPSITAGFVVGNANGANAAVYQSGSTAVTAQPTGGAWQLGSVPGASGYYNLSSGTMLVTNGGEFDPGGSGGGAGTFGQFDMSGGSLIVGLTNSTGASYFLPNRGGVGEVSVVNISGGTVAINSNMTESATFGGFEINWAAGGQTNTTTISGGAVFTSPSESVKLNQNNNAANVCSLNLNGGLFQILGFTAGHCASAAVNFNGGTLKAGNSANANFMGNVASVYLYGNGGTIDNNGLAISIGQVFSSPTGNGVASIAVGTAGSGYIVPPQVTIVGDGTGATAYTTINAVSGAVTGVVVTCPGTGYSSTPTVSLTGGGGLGASAGTVTMAANTSGALTFTGAGTTTLNGAYNATGGINLVAGTLSLNTANGVPSPAGDLTVSNATLTLNAAGGTPLPANNVSVRTGSTLNLTVYEFANAINASGTLFLGTNTTLNLNYGNVNPNPTVPAIASAGSLTKGTNIVINISAGGLSIGSFPLITAGSAVTTNNFKLGTLPPGIVAVLTNSTANSLDLLITGAGQLLSWHGANADNSIVMTNWNINANANWYDLSFNLTKYLQYSGNAYGDNVTFGDNGYNTDGTNNVSLTNAVVPATVTFSSGSPYRLTGAGGIGGIASLLLTNGAASFYLETSNTYTGGTVIGSGALAITNDNALGAVAGSVSLAGGVLQINASTTNNRSLTVNANSSIGVIAGATDLWSGIVAGTAQLTKIDNGTLNLTGNNTFSGATAVRFGTLQVSGGSFGSTNADIQISPTFGDTGTLTVSSGNVYDNRVIISGNSANSGTFGVAVVNQTGGTITSRQWFTVGSGANGGSSGDGTFNMSGGTLNCQNQQMEVGNFDATTGTVNMSGSSAINIWNNTLIALGANNNAASGTFNQNGGAVTFYSDSGVTPGGNGFLHIGRAGTLTGTFTYNLNGGTLTVPQVQGNVANAATRAFNFNGGTLRAAKSNTTFMFGLTAANVLAGGAIIDSSSNSVTISQALLDGGTGGGLTKQGTGSLILSGTNTYTGLTTVSSGTLLLTPAHQAVGAFTVANNAKFGVVASSVSNSATIGALTLGSSGASTLGFTYGFVGNPTNAVLTAGAVIISGTSTIQIGGSFTLGAFPVLKYTSLSGSFNTTVSAPRGMGASVSNDTVNKVIYVVVTSLASPIVWTGNNSIVGKTNLWDLNTTTNWLSGVDPTTYQETLPPGDAVFFNDLGTSLVLLSNTASPASVTISNAVVSYNFQGSGHISGPAGLVKQGSGTAKLTFTGNDYTGNTVVSNGVLQLGVANSIPDGVGKGNVSVNGAGILDLNTFSEIINGLSGSGTVDTVAGGTPTLIVGGNDASSTFAGSITNTAGTLTLIKTNNGTFTLTGTNGYLGGTRANGGTLVLAGNLPHSGVADFISVNNVGATNAVLKIVPGANLDRWDMPIAEVASSRGAVYQSGGTLNLNRPSSIDDFKLGSGANSYGYYSLSGGILSGLNEVGIGGNAASTVGVMDITGGTMNSPGWLTLGRGTGTSSGILNVSGSGQVVLTSALDNTRHFRINWANTAGAQSIVTVSGGGQIVGPATNTFTLDLSGANTAGTLGEVNINSGGLIQIAAVTSGNANPDTLLNFNGGTLKATVANAAFITDANIDGIYVYPNGATIHDNGVAVTVSRPLLAPTDSGVLSIAVTDGGSGYIGAPMVAITGGTGRGATAVANMVDDGTGKGTFKVNSLTITCPGVYTSDPTTVTLTGGGSVTSATIGAITTAANSSGGLTKTGNGTLTLNGVNTYTGLTAVNAGTLAGIGTIAGAVTVGSGAGLTPGDNAIGTLTVNGNLTLSGLSTNVFEVNGSTSSNDRVAAGAAVNYGGLLKIVPTGTFTVGQQFLLFTGAGATNASNFASVQSTVSGTVFSFTNGVLSVTSVGPTGSNQLTNSVTGGGTTLSLSWGAGWKLQMQTNSLSTGLSTNWTYITDGTLTSTNIIINPAKPTVFYRLVYP